MKKIKFLFFTLLFCFSVPVKADTAFENDDTVLCSFLKENVPENASPIESSLENEYRKTSSKPIDFYFFKRSEKTKSFQDLYAANVLTYQEKSDRSLLYQTVFDFQNITQVRTAKEDFIRLETDPLMYLFELEKAELWTRNSTEEPWTLERKSQRLETQIFIFLIASFLLIKNIFEFWHLFPGARALLRKAKFLRQNIIAFIPLCIRYIRFR